MLPDNITEAACDKSKKFITAFENADAVYTSFITSRCLDQLKGQPATTLAGVFFMARAMGDTDIQPNDVIQMFVEHQKHQKEKPTAESNGQFEHWFLRFCDQEIQRLEPQLPKPH